MYIAPLQQALCSDRCQVTNGPEPSDWIVPSLPVGWHLLSFHFFVDWRHTPPAVADRIWITRQLRLDFGETLDSIQNADVLEAFRRSVLLQEFEILERAAVACKHKVSVILLPEIPVPEISDDTFIWVIYRGIEGLFCCAKHNVLQLKFKIQQHSGGPVKVGAKGLRFGTSALECYLSSTDAAFPGDADAVIVDDNDQIRGIVEYKKHTLDVPINQHLATKYYPYPDGRKYQRLQALTTRCRDSLPNPIPLIILYYSTKSPVIRLQEISTMDASKMTISRDSGDISVDNNTPATVVGWLGIL
ncbi:hypothetical protein [Aeromonas veronii]|uniref:hypothetical protein n=1 Tax=Aeromonas veronii TaxID=654 RepID=UPI0038F4673F